ncbi:MASE1 domain-containing protein [Pseudoroseomonas wenyumeiae]
MAAGLVPAAQRPFWVMMNLSVALAYLGLGCAVGYFFSVFGLFPAPIWLPAGIAATACMLGGRRLVPGIFLGSFVVNALVFGATPGVAAAVSVGNALGPLAGVMLMRRLRPETGLFTRFSGVMAFILGAVLLHALVTATIGTLALLLLGGLPWHSGSAAWGAWVLCDAGGTFYFTPSLVLWLGLERMPRCRGAAPAAGCCCWMAPSGWPPRGWPRWSFPWRCRSACPRRSWSSCWRCRSPGSRCASRCVPPIRC